MAEDSIVSLEAREHIRLRPGMYAGDTSTPNQLLLEIFSNALDMHTAGFGNQIKVKIEDCGICEIEDCGNGFPIDEKREDGETTLQASFDVINTSGKFTDDGLYEGTSLGLNGIGSKLTNFLSSWLEVLSWQNGKYEKLRFEEGILKERDCGKWTGPKSGTIVRYKPDPQFFDTDKTSAKFFNDFFNDICCLCPQLEIIFSSSLGQNVKISHPNGIEDLINRRVGDAIELIDNRLVISEKVGDSSLDMAISFTGNNSSNIISYVNYGLTTVGPHITGIKSTITRVINNWAKENNLLKKGEKNLDGASAQEGMLLVSNIVTKNVAYNAQVKTTITKIDSSFVNTILARELELWLDQNPTDGKKIIEKALVARRAAEAAKKARAAVKQKATQETKKKIKVATMPSKLADCFSKDRSKCELYVTEGDSASGGAKVIRNAEFQAILGLRGKVLNCLTADRAKILKNAEIVDIMKALGLDWSATGKHVNYNPDKLRYGKFIIAADRDSDGSHIQTLILTMLWTLCPDLVIDGYVYIALPPLYKAEWGKNYEYLDDKKALKEFEKSHSNFTLTYFKGLGEADPEELGNMILNPETRNIQQVTVEDIGKATKILQDLMGSDTQPKKEFIFGNEIVNIM